MQGWWGWMYLCFHERYGAWNQGRGGEGKEKNKVGGNQSLAGPLSGGGGPVPS